MTMNVAISLGVFRWQVSVVDVLMSGSAFSLSGHQKDLVFFYSSPILKSNQLWPLFFFTAVIDW